MKAAHVESGGLSGRRVNVVTSGRSIVHEGDEAHEAVAIPTRHDAVVVHRRFVVGPLASDLHRLIVEPDLSHAWSQVRCHTFTLGRVEEIFHCNHQYLTAGGDVFLHDRAVTEARHVSAGHIYFLANVPHGNLLYLR